MSNFNSDNFPFCSVIVLNYYGERVIEDTLESLLGLKYPSNRYEIIVVDNNSKDKSKEILQKYVQMHNNVRLFFLKKNLGFSRGNNVGIRQAKGEYICLLNNDCFVEKNWLTELVLTAQKDKKIFAVNSKVLLYPSYIYPRIRLNQDFVIKEAVLKSSNLLKFTGKQIALDAMWSDDPSDRVFTLEIPFDRYHDSFITCQINLLTSNFSKNKSIPLKSKNLSDDIMKISYKKAKGMYTATLKINLGLLKEEDKYDKIQNAGIVVFQEGSGRDNGAIIRYHKQYYEFDRKQFDKEREVYAVCAAASLYRKDILDKIGYLDESFFMYYEDVEISERARLLGYKNYFSPHACVRHLHALSSREWSPFFIYNVEKGRYLHLLFYFPYSTYLFVIGFFRLFINGLARLLAGSNNSNQMYNLQYLMLVGYFLISFPKLLYITIRKRSNIPQRRLIENLNTIISGRWYFGKD